MSDAEGTVIVLNWQGEEWLEDCLRTLLDQTVSGYRVIVVDNGSRDGSPEIAGRFDVEWLPLGSNIGFSAANNAAARHASGEWIIFVNNDMRFDRAFVETISRRLFAEESTFAVDVGQRDWNGNRSHGAVRVTTARTGQLAFAESYPDQETRVAFGNGGALGVRRDRFHELGGWDERMFAGSEDVDLCWRAWLRGWSTVHLPEVLAEAKIGGASSTEEGRAIRRRAVVKGQLVFATKHLPFRLCLRGWLGVLPRVVARRELAPAALQTIVALPGLLAERRRLYAGTSPAKHLAAMRGLG